MLDPHVRRTDEIYQGRMIILGTFAGFVLAWATQFLSCPVLLVPGFIYDATLGTLLALLFLGAQFVCVGFFLLLLWAGVAWARYVVGALLFLLGLPYIIDGLFAEAFGGAQLIYGALCLVGSIAIILSLSIRTYLKERREKGVPWLSLAIAGSSLIVTPLVVAGIDLIRTYQLVQTNRQETAQASDLMGSFAESLDAQVINRAADDDLKQRLLESDFTGQCQGFREELGQFQSFEEIKPAKVAELVLSPGRRESLEWTAVAHYEKGDVFMTLQENYRGGEGQADAFYFNFVPRKGSH